MLISINDMKHKEAPYGDKMNLQALSDGNKMPPDARFAVDITGA